jgi:hypothetical protein
VVRAVTTVSALGAGLACAGLIWMSSAQAVAPTRTQYIARVDPICAKATKDGVRLANRLTPLLDEKRFDEAGRIYSRYWSNNFRPVIRRISRIQPPAEDSRRMRKWIRVRFHEARVGEHAAEALQHGPLKSGLRGVEHGVPRLDHVADRLIRPMGFQICDQP